MFPVLFNLADALLGVTVHLSYRFREVRQIAAERARLEAENSRLRRRLQQVSSADGVSTALSPDASLSFSYVCRSRGAAVGVFWEPRVLSCLRTWDAY